MPRAMFKHRVRSPGQNTLGTDPLRSMTPARPVPWAGGTASTLFIPFPRYHRPGVTHNSAAISTIYFDYGTDVTIFVARPSHRIRLYSTKTFKLLGTLDYHKGGIQAVTFARSTPPVHYPSKNRSGEGGTGLALALHRLRLRKGVMTMMMRSLAAPRSKRGDGGS